MLSKLVIVFHGKITPMLVERLSKEKLKKILLSEVIAVVLINAVNQHRYEWLSK
jgi:hypothetical protein